MARRRAARSVKTVGLRPFVVDDVGAAAPGVPTERTEGPAMSLSGRERLDERLRRWEVERTRFERAAKARAAAGATDAPGTPNSDPSH